MAELDLRYPKAKYHKKLPVALVANASEEVELGEGWFDHPSLKNKPVFLQSGEVVDAEVLEVETKPAKFTSAFEPDTKMEIRPIEMKAAPKPVGRPRKTEPVEAE